MVLLHAAALQPRIRQITIEHALSIYMSVVDVPVHRGVTESVVPGVLRHYDLDDLMIAIAPRTITIVNPRDAAGSELSQTDFERQLARAYGADRSLHLPDRLKFSTRAAGEPLSILYSDAKQ